MAVRYETLAEVNERLAAQHFESERAGMRPPRGALKARMRASAPVGLVLALFAVLALGLILLAGFVFHEVGIVTPLDGLYMWLHDTFGGGEPTVAKFIWRPSKFIW